LSARYSTSPALHLRIAESRIQRYLCALYLLIYVLGLAWVWYVCRTAWVLGALLVVLATAFRYRRQALAGSSIGWRAGQWWHESDCGREAIFPIRWHCLPWVTFLAWRDGAGRSISLWLFADSADREMLRRLRVRLALERRV